VEASGSEYITAAQDTTYYNYSGQRAMVGLGEIQGKVRGLLQHNVLLLDQLGLPLGLLTQQYVELLLRVHQPRHLDVIESQQLHKLPQVYPHLGD